MKRLRFFGLFLAILGMTVFLTQATVMGGTEEQLRAVIDYVLGDGVTIAAMPEGIELSFDLPIPENSQLLASIVSDNPNQVESDSKIIRLLMRSEGISPSAIAEFYQAYLLENGWEELAFEFNENRGFYASDSFDGRYCLARDYYLYYTLWASEISETSQIDWDITLITMPSNDECRPYSSDLSGYTQLWDFIPQFATIDGVELLPYVSGPVHNPYISVTYVAGLEFSIPLETVFDTYNQELLAVGWLLEDSEIHESFAQSNWTIQGGVYGELSGRLLILQKTSGSNEYTAYVSVER